MPKTLDEYRAEFHQCTNDAEIRDFLYRSYRFIYEHIKGVPYIGGISVRISGNPIGKMVFNIEALDVLDVLRTFSPDMFDRVSGGSSNTSGHVQSPFVPTGGYQCSPIDVSEHIAAMNAAGSWDVWWKAWRDGLHDFALQRLQLDTSPAWLDQRLEQLDAWFSEHSIVATYPIIHFRSYNELVFGSSYSSIENTFHFPDTLRIFFDENPLVNMRPGRSRLGFFVAEPQAHWNILRDKINTCGKTLIDVEGKAPAYRLQEFYRYAESSEYSPIDATFF